MSNIGFTPDFRIEVDGLPLTDKLRSRLISLDFNDEAGIKSDTIDLRLKNPLDDEIPLPAPKAKARISLGYVETGVTYVGTFTLDERGVGGDPNVYMKLRGNAVDMGGNAKTRKTKSHTDKTIKDVVEDTVKDMGGLTAKVDEKLGKIKLPHIDRTNESGLHFLTRLAERYGGVFKVIDGKAVFAQRDNVKSLAGKDVPTINIDYSDPDVLSGWSFDFQERGKNEKVKARYVDWRKGKEDVVEVDGSKDAETGTSRTLSQKFGSKEEAEAAAAAEADRLHRGTGTGTLVMIGNPAFAAEGTVNLSGFSRAANRKWRIKSVAHSMTSDSYTCTLSLDTPKDDKSSGKTESK